MDLGESTLPLRHAAAVTLRPREKPPTPSELSTFDASLSLQAPTHARPEAKTSTAKSGSTSNPLISAPHIPSSLQKQDECMLMGIDIQNTSRWDQYTDQPTAAPSSGLDQLLRRSEGREAGPPTFRRHEQQYREAEGSGSEQQPSLKAGPSGSDYDLLAVRAATDILQAEAEQKPHSSSLPHQRPRTEVTHASRLSSQQQISMVTASAAAASAAVAARLDTECHGQDGGQERTEHSRLPKDQSGKNSGGQKQSSSRPEVISFQQQLQQRQQQHRQQQQQGCQQQQQQQQQQQPQQHQGGTSFQQQLQQRQQQHRQQQTQGSQQQQQQQSQQHQGGQQRRQQQQQQQQQQTHESFQRNEHRQQQQDEIDLTDDLPEGGETMTSGPGSQPLSWDKQQNTTTSRPFGSGEGQAGAAGALGPRPSAPQGPGRSSGGGSQWAAMRSISSQPMRVQSDCQPGGVGEGAGDRVLQAPAGGGQRKRDPKAQAKAAPTDDQPKLRDSTLDEFFRPKPETSGPRRSSEADEDEDPTKEDDFFTLVDEAPARRSGGGAAPKRKSMEAGPKDGPKRPKATAASIDPLFNSSEDLQFDSQVKDASEPAAAAHFQQVLASSMALVASVLYSTTEGGMTMYHSATQLLNKQQQHCLRKARAQAAKGKAKEQEPPQQQETRMAGLGILAVTSANSQVLTRSAQSARATASTVAARLAGSGPVFFIPTSTPAEVQASKQPLQALLGALARSNATPFICCDAKALLRELIDLGLTLPENSTMRLVDPCILTWMKAPDCFDEKDAAQHYTLEAIMTRKGMGEMTSYDATPDSCSRKSGAPSTSKAALKWDSQAPSMLCPLPRLHKGLVATLVAFEVITPELRWLRPEAIAVEIQVTGILARMEAMGIAFHAAAVSVHRQLTEGRLEVLRSKAARLVGHEFNLSSAAQLAQVLYEELKLPVPTSVARGAAKKLHAPTDEASLKQLASRHPLPDLVLEHRQLTNFLSKYCDPSWVQAAAASAEAEGLPWARVKCNWNQMQTATGRLSSSSPNLQAVTKYQVAVTLQDAGGGGGAAQEMVNIRSAFIAPAGRLLISADYSQIELRILAHMSGDRQLVQRLKQAGDKGDAFTLIAAAFLPSCQRGTISKEDREKAKRVVYGMIYGLSAVGLAAQLKDQGIDVAAAGRLIKSFMQYFSGVQPFMERCAEQARRTGFVETLLGRRRPIMGIKDADHNVRAEGERKAVNSTIQGSAADLIKVAMVNWISTEESWPQEAGADRRTGSPRPVELIAQIHDELLFECDEHVVGQACKRIREVMESAWELDVPLIVRLQAGRSWGCMEEHKGA